MPKENAEWQIMTTVAGIGVILLVATMVVVVVRSVRQPAVIGEILAGVILGPSVLGLFPGDLTGLLFPAELRPQLSVVAQIGVLLFLFVVGWEFTPATIRGHRRSTGLIWLSSIVTPMLLGVAMAWLLYPRYGVVDGRQVGLLGFTLYLSVAMSVTAFPVLARIISEYRLQSSRVGVLALALAAADDVFAWCVLAAVVALVTTSGSAALISVLAWSVIYVVAMFWVVRPLLAWAFQRMSAAQPWPVMVTAAGVLLSAYVTSVIGIHAIFGAFMFGLVMPRSLAPALRAAVQVPLERVGQLLMPVFFVVTGLSVDLTTITGMTLLITVGIVVAACLGKLGGVTVAARLSGLSPSGSLVLGLLMNTRGLTELVVLNVGLGLGLLSTELFSAMVVMAVVTTAMAAPLLSLTLRSSAAVSSRPDLRQDAGPAAPALPTH
ncbi:cation:proton antiporter [Nonomuraea sp. NPDC003560]|uniref:cation:proton antiporter domain-containing protein n=1 Tax=Nonomuraea sp. NPDC003560 TaxID=3364341 RepID=UPI00369266E4